MKPHRLFSPGRVSAEKHCYRLLRRSELSRSPSRQIQKANLPCMRLSEPLCRHLTRLLGHFVACFLSFFLSRGKIKLQETLTTLSKLCSENQQVCAQGHSSPCHYCQHLCGAPKSFRYVLIPSQNFYHSWWDPSVQCTTSQWLETSF